MYIINGPRSERIFLLQSVAVQTVQIVKLSLALTINEVHIINGPTSTFTVCTDRIDRKVVLTDSIRLSVLDM